MDVFGCCQSCAASKVGIKARWPAARKYFNVSPKLSKLSKKIKKTYILILSMQVPGVLAFPRFTATPHPTFPLTARADTNKKTHKESNERLCALQEKMLHELQRRRHRRPWVRIIFCLPAKNSMKSRYIWFYFFLFLEQFLFQDDPLGITSSALSVSSVASVDASLKQFQNPTDKSKS